MSKKLKTKHFDAAHVANILRSVGIADAGETAFIAQELEYVSSQVFEHLRTPLKGMTIVPVNTQVPAGADTFAYDSWDSVGSAKFISNYATDFPSVDAFRNRESKPIASIGASYSYTIQDLRAAAMAPKGSLDQRRARTARQVIDTKIDDLIAFGDAARNLGGFVNDTTVPLVEPTTGQWAAAPADATEAEALLADLQKLMANPKLVTQEVFGQEGSLTLVLPPSVYEWLNVPFGDNRDKTLLRYFLDNNPYLRDIVQWQKLETADDAGTGPRAIVFPRDPMVCEFVLPVEYETFPPQLEKMQFTVPVHARVGSTVFHHPYACGYIDLASTPS